jgi:hypothetical protein
MLHVGSDLNIHTYATIYGSAPPLLLAHRRVNVSEVWLGRCVAAVLLISRAAGRQLRNRIGLAASNPRYNLLVANEAIK